MFNLILKRNIRKAVNKVILMNDEREFSEILPLNITHKTYDYISDCSPFHELDIQYNNKVNKDSPVIIDVHGGAWMMGDKDLNRNFAYHLAEYNYKVVTFGYRPCNTNGVYLKEQVQDVFKVFEYLYQNQKELELNLKDLYIAGDSSGAMLVLLALAINQNEELSKIYGVKHVDLNFKAVELNHPAPFPTGIPDEKIANFRAKTLNRFLANILAHNSHTLVAKNMSFESYVDKVQYPPLYIVSSLGDFGLIPQTYKLVEILKEKGINYTLNIVQDKSLPHVFNVNFPNTKEAFKVNKSIIDFFKKNN